MENTDNSTAERDRVRSTDELADWKPISTAPLNGRTILVRNKKYPHAHAMGWSNVRGRWEGMAFTLMRAVPTWWDKRAEQPDEWREVGYAAAGEQANEKGQPAQTKKD